MRLAACTSLQVLGARLVGDKQYKTFRGVMIAYSVYTALVGIIVAAAAVVPFAKPISYRYGQSACVYASTVECAPLYDDIFGGDDPLHVSFSWFSMIVALNCVYLFLKPALYACLDFQFMFRASVGALCSAFPLAIIVARFGFDSAPSAIFVAMYAPHLLLVPVFGWRLFHNVRLMSNDEEGPWTAHQRQVSEMSGKVLPGKAQRAGPDAIELEESSSNKAEKDDSQLAMRDDDGAPLNAEKASFGSRHPWTRHVPIVRHFFNGNLASF